MNPFNQFYISDLVFMSLIGCLISNSYIKYVYFLFQQHFEALSVW